jgi:hypothetical protein
MIDPIAVMKKALPDELAWRVFRFLRLEAAAT